MLDSTKLLALERTLKARLRGEVTLDTVSRGIYATDASNYMMMPVAVVMPADQEDLASVLEIAAEFGVSLLPRGGGTSLAGQAVGHSVILDFTRHMDRILEIDPDGRRVRVQPGVVRDNLNAELARYGLHFAPDPATSSRATVGGMVGNNSSGTRSIIYGKTVDHTLETKVMLDDREVLEFKSLNSQEYARKASSGNREGKILQGFKRIIDSNREEILRTYPKVMRRVGGYNLDEFTNGNDWNLAKLITGSEGTLATMLEVTLNLEPLPRHTALSIVHFNDLLEGIRSVEQILAHGPSAVEVLDHTVLSLARQNLTTAPLCDFLREDPAAILIVEFFGESREEAVGKAEKLAGELQGRNVGYAVPVLSDPAAQARVWEVRKKGLGLLLGLRADRKPIPDIEDACVPIKVLAEYVEKVLEICRSHKIEVVLYAHASVGVIHIRPILDLKRGEDIERMKAIADAAFELVKQYGGSWSSEHGDGLARSHFLEPFYGPRIYQAFREVKTLFDPSGLMNPGKIIDAPPRDKNLRYGAGYVQPEVLTEYKYRDSRSFGAAVEMCNGVGECRKTLAGTMCPSYRATRDEEHSTRGRANALRLAMTGQFGPEGLESKRLYEVLDLCLSCKACKSECPSNVDIAKLKSEFLQKYHDRHGATLRERMVAASPVLAGKFTGWKAPLVNRVMESWLFRALLERAAGFDRRRVLPAYAREPFGAWLSGRPGKTAAKHVVLFDDCYLNFNEPQVGISAVELLESCGYEVIVAKAGCCQRARISHGFLREARLEGEQTLRRLDEHIRRGLQVVVCEPSCASALTDDLPDLIEDEGLGRRVRGNVLMIDDFLLKEIESGKLAGSFSSPLKEIVIHGHCHQKSLYGGGAMKKILGRVAGLAVKEIDSGCCGMAGSFGYEKEHYDLSLKIGEERLFQAVRNLASDTALVACGFSCRHQIRHATRRMPLHWVETLRANGAR